jgi:hypothetical protein
MAKAAKKKTDEERLDELADDAEEQEKEDEESEAPSSEDDPAEDDVAVEDKSDRRAPPRIGRRRPGRPRKNPTPYATQYAKRMIEGTSEATMFASKDLVTIWNMVVDRAREEQLGPEHIAIGVKRLGIGPMPSGVQDLTPINGDQVMGDENTSPGEALVNYTIYNYHLPTARGPKLYRYHFYYRTGQRNQLSAPIAELRLAAPEEVQAELNAKQQFAQQKAIDEAVKRGTGYRAQGMGGPPQPPPWYPPQGPNQPPNPYPPPYPYQPQGPFGYALPPLPQGASPEIQEMRREVSAMMGAFQERARLEGLTPPSPPVAPGPSAEELATTVSRVVAQTLVGLGFTPELARKLSSPAVNSQSIQAAVADPLQQMETMFTLMDRFRKMDMRMREQFEPEEEPQPKALPAAAETKVEVDRTALKPIPLVQAFGKVIQYGERRVPSNNEEGVEETHIDHWIRLGMGNPELVGQAVNFLFTKFGDSAIGKLIAGFAAQGLPQLAAAAQQQRAALPQVVNGAAPNGMPPQTPAPTQTAVAASGWSGPPKL